MTTTLSTLANGLRVVSHEMPHLGTVALGVWVASGARHESEAEHGISHLLEHMAFKGTRARSAQDIAEEIEQVGGEINAATSLDTTCYYSRVLKDDVGVALEILADIIQNSTYDEGELEREREVILQEIAATRDSPDDTVYDLFQETAFPGQPLGRPILGTPESVASFTAGDLRSFLARRYRAGNMVLSAAGNIRHETLVRFAERLFGGLSDGTPGDAVSARYVGGPRISSRPFEQAHVLLGYEGLSYRNPAFYSAQVFSGLLGGGMSSRLFQEVREKRGLCYSIYSSAWGLGDTGLLSVHASTGPEMLDELVGVVREQLRRAASDRPDEREVQRSKAQLKTGLAMSLESSVSRAEQMSRQLLAFGRLLTAEELVDRVESVTSEAVRETAAKLLTGSLATMALVGAGADAERIAARAVASMG
ncbi:MAG: pitrilysin family protein [Hyphomicrobiaceae bacterium]|nr:pitrilysin family protein [Hyphomicrobiaceae bacterium]